MTAGKVHFLGNCEHLGVNGLALHPGCLYSNAPNINQFRKNRKICFSFSSNRSTWPVHSAPHWGLAEESWCGIKSAPLGWKPSAGRGPTAGPSLTESSEILTCSCWHNWWYTHGLAWHVNFLSFFSTFVKEWLNWLQFQNEKDRD